jgi:hypothetical protein
MLDRESSFDRRTASQGGSHTQGGSERDGKAGAIAGSSGLEIPTNHMVNPTTSNDENSVTGRSNFSHQLMHYVDVTFAESESEADFKAFIQSVAKRKYSGHSESPIKRQKLSVEDHDDSLTESDDGGPCMYPRISLFASADWLINRTFYVMLLRVASHLSVSVTPFQ